MVGAYTSAGAMCETLFRPVHSRLPINPNESAEGPNIREYPKITHCTLTIAYVIHACNITVSECFLLVRPPYKNPTPAGVIIMTNTAAVYMNVVSPVSIHGPLLFTSVSTCVQWSS